MVTFVIELYGLANYLRTCCAIELHLYNTSEAAVSPSKQHDAKDDDEGEGVRQGHGDEDAQHLQVEEGQRQGEPRRQEGLSSYISYVFADIILTIIVYCFACIL